MILDLTLAGLGRDDHEMNADDLTPEDQEAITEALFPQGVPSPAPQRLSDEQIRLAEQTLTQRWQAELSRGEKSFFGERRITEVHDVTFSASELRELLSQVED